MGHFAKGSLANAGLSVHRQRLEGYDQTERQPQSLARRHFVGEQQPRSELRILTQPAVYLVGTQTVHQAELDRFLADHGVTWQSDSSVGGEVLTETAGRLCYLSYAKPRPGGNAAYLGHILEVGHGSVLEHAVFNLIITGVSRSLTHELVRHRHMSYSQLSQRYVDESVAEYVEPAIIAQDPALHAVWVAAIEAAHRAYVTLAEHLAARLATDPGAGTATERRKAARQAARSVLPNATETKIFVTANARALRHFLELRGSRHAEPEIRKLAVAILDTLAPVAPHLFGDYRKVPLPDGSVELHTDYRKV
jgi:thymidylate synthase (FAD)